MFSPTGPLKQPLHTLTLEYGFMWQTVKAAKALAHLSELQIVFIQGSETQFLKKKKKKAQKNPPKVQALNVQRGVPKDAARWSSLTPTEFTDTLLIDFKWKTIKSSKSPYTTASLCFAISLTILIQFWISVRKQNKIFFIRSLSFLPPCVTFISENCCELFASCSAIKGKYIYLTFLVN